MSTAWERMTGANGQVRRWGNPGLRNVAVGPGDGKRKAQPRVQRKPAIVQSLRQIDFVCCADGTVVRIKHGAGR